MSNYKITGTILTMKYGKRTIDQTVETDMVLSGRVTVDQLVALGVAPEGTTEDTAMADVIATPLHMVEVINWNEVKKLQDVVDFIKRYHPELITVATVTRQGGGSTLTIEERANAGYYSRYNLVKNSKTGETDAVQFTPSGKYEVTSDLVRGWIESGKVSKPALVCKLKELYGV